VEAGSSERGPKKKNQQKKISKKWAPTFKNKTGIGKTLHAFAAPKSIDLSGRTNVLVPLVVPGMAAPLFVPHCLALTADASTLALGSSSLAGGASC
jgi:hypothetical protein